MPNEYGLKAIPEGVSSQYPNGPLAHSTIKWSSAIPIPKIGDRVVVKTNGFGPGTVEAYFHEHGWLGLEVRLDSRPAWLVKQCPVERPVKVFGAEVSKP